MPRSVIAAAGYHSNILLSIDTNEPELVNSLLF